jgi:ATP synthase F1 delta subunit
MKITSGQYAKSLYEATLEKSHAEADVLAANFIKILTKNGQLKLKNEILQKFEIIFNQKNGIVAIEVISREKLSREVLEKLNEYIKKRYFAKEVIIDNKINEEMKGGIVVKVGHEMMDASIGEKLRKMKSVLVS